jgi:hypothetical protein
MSITIQDIISSSKPHPNGSGGRHTVLSDGKVRVSIVGGARGLYGDFIEDFEVAVIDEELDSFVTKFFSPNNNDDVIGYMSSK